MNNDTIAGKFDQVAGKIKKPSAKPSATIVSQTPEQRIR